MEHHWPQSFAVSIMRRVRPDLEREHARILRKAPEELFDQEAIRPRAHEGDIAVQQHRSGVYFHSFEGAARM
jgi:hypothetical protein